MSAFRRRSFRYSSAFLRKFGSLLRNSAKEIEEDSDKEKEEEKKEQRRSLSFRRSFARKREEAQGTTKEQEKEEKGDSHEQTLTTSFSRHNVYYEKKFVCPR